MAKASAKKGKAGGAKKSSAMKGGPSKAAAKSAVTAKTPTKTLKAAKPAAKTSKGKAKSGPTVRRDAPKPAKAAKGKAKTGRFGEIVIQEAGHAEVKRLKLKEEKLKFQPAKSKARFKEETYEDFFTPEIEAELRREATIFNDRVARWRCQCCDAIIPIPRRTEVFHGDYHLVHDDVEGLLVNGEKFVPKAYTPIEVHQPGRLRNPWTGKTIEGKDLGTTGTS